MKKAKRKIKLKISTRILKKKRVTKAQKGAKRCRFCFNAELAASIDYKNAGLLKGFLTERGKILPSRISGNCCYHQRQLDSQVKRARTMALLPFTAVYF